MKFIRDLLSESGSISTVRVMSLASLIVGSSIAIYGVIQGKDLGGVTELVSVFIGAAFAGKVGQKFIEK